MTSKDIKQEIFEIIREYKRILKNTAKRTYGVPESMLPRNKDVIRSAIKAALLLAEDKDQVDVLKTDYIALANFIPDSEAEKTEDISQDHFSFLEMDEDRKREFLKERFKSGLIGDYELAIKITKKMAEEQKQRRVEIDEFCQENKIEW